MLIKIQQYHYKYVINENTDRVNGILLWVFLICICLKYITVQLAMQFLHQIIHSFGPVDSVKQLNFYEKFQVTEIK